MNIINNRYVKNTVSFFEQFFIISLKCIVEACIMLIENITVLLILLSLYYVSFYARYIIYNLIKYIIEGFEDVEDIFKTILGGLKYAFKQIVDAIESVLQEIDKIKNGAVDGVESIGHDVTSLF